ncbi:MAG: outer membrane beta-barrel protein, partial [Candidatus Kapaibacterium sp.]
MKQERINRKQERKRCAGALMLLTILAWWAASAPPTAQAQILSRGNLFGPGATPPMVGIEIGFGQHAEQGNLLCDCGANFKTGTGTGLLGSLLFELPLTYEWAVGIKAGIDFKNFNTDANENEVVIIVPSGNSSELDTVSMYVHRTGKVTATYLGFTPYVQYQFFRMGPFVQAGLNVGFLVGNNLSQNRELLQDTVTTTKGVFVQNLTFTNGTTSESIQEGANTSVNTLRLG